MDNQTSLFVFAVIAFAVGVGIVIGWTIFRTWRAGKVSFLESQNAALRWQAEEASRQLMWARWELSEMRAVTTKAIQFEGAQLLARCDGAPSPSQY